MYIINSIRFIAILAIIALNLAVSGCNKPKEMQQPVPEVAVAVMRYERVPITTELPGRTSAYLVAEVRPQVSGIIQKRLFTEGSDVKTGDVLYQIDPAPYRAALNNAIGALGRAEANLPAIRSKYERYKDLVNDKAVSQQEYEDIAAAYKQAEADIQYWKASVESARINLGYTSITAPITGRIGKSNVTVGALVTANQPSAMAVIQQIDPIYVDATQSSASQLQLKGHIEAGRIKNAGKDQTRVKLLLEDGTSYKMEGILKFSDVTVEPSTGSFILRMVFPNPKSILLPGMYVRAVIQEGVIEQAILVPQQGVFRDPKGNPFTMIVDAEGKVQQIKLTLGRAIGDKWNVSEGLKVGDRVIIEGIQKVRPGAPAKVVSPGTDVKDSEEAKKTANPLTKTGQAPTKNK
ncbi:MAG TPA: efflux RND transporter periplasmic adaptor subunit [Syntrophorhabdus sp.]|nr:efflux RND transporter periplasmic adaptor subunit [Syntrophorhabdaceae bacterium]HNS78130.1 efflux RND transporter periplasmic adaptor subunit [Syntrophorhabdus sp.]HOF58204.1 efflux RND transporter periplasmic adaptor subunit [Syntrophorhabdaceae bacterium]HOS06129.1 efflux RND transporter periplasmic adaptor subunit [Syntrophorhabdaceae bacterium]HPL41581.1 efflux RND transporter periplasmic adaptor subunit [Syntrophorhabdaceae bacterium]